MSGKEKFKYQGLESKEEPIIVKPILKKGDTGNNHKIEQQNRRRYTRRPN